MIDKRKTVYVFRGAPSSGKGTLTKEFIKLLSGKVAYIELDQFRWGYHLTNRQVVDVSEEEHKFAYENFLQMLDNYCSNGNYTIVCEGLFSWREHGAHGNMNDLVNIFKKHNFNFKLFCLEASKEVLWDRNTKRKYTVPKEEFDQLFDYVGSSEADKETIIDVENNSVEESVKILAENI